MSILELSPPLRSSSGGRDDAEDLIARHRASGDPRLRERAIERYMPLAHRLAAHYQRGPETFEDLLQVAYVGLVKAVDRFDPERGVRFSSFAIPTISGELRRHFRGTAWNVHVPRGLQETILALAKASDALNTRLGRAPTVDELAEEIGVDAEEVLEALHARDVQHCVSLDQPRGDEDATTISEVVGGDDERLDHVDHRVTVAPLIRELPEREREILYLRFARDLTQSEIAARVGCSQMQVSRLLRRAIATLSQVSDEPQPLRGPHQPAVPAARAAPRRSP